MGKRNRNIIIWALTWAVLFLVVAYSPIGRPDLYVATSYYSYNQGVSFKGEIANAPTSKSYTQTEDADIKTPAYTPIESSNGEYAENASKFNSQNNSSNSAIQGNKSTNYSQGSTGNAALSFGSSRQQAQGTATAQNGDVSSLSSDLTLNSTATTRQSVQMVDKNKGGPKPGGDPSGPPIPIGDGLWLLLFMATTYAIWKKQQATRVNTTVHK